MIKVRNKKEDQNIQKIEQFFKVPERVADQIKNVVEKVKAGYVLFETRPRWDGSPGPWTKLPVAKIIFHKPSQGWRVYWMRASGRWWFYAQYKSLNTVLKAIDEDKYGYFWD